MKNLEFYNAVNRSISASINNESMGHGLLLEVAELSVQRNRKNLLQGLHFQVRAGEFVAVIGANGAGKSTLVRAVTGEWDATGKIKIFGRNLASWTRKELAQRMAVMSQKTHLDFSFTAQQVVEIGRLPHTRFSASHNSNVAREVLNSLTLTEYADRALTSLSGGEAQKVQFARAVTQLSGATEPTLLILDEPTAALDLAQQKVILDATRHSCQSNNAVLAVLHDLNQVALYADRVLVLRNGRLICDAPTAQALTPPILSEAYGVNIRVEVLTDGRRIILVD